MQLVAVSGDVRRMTLPGREDDYRAPSRGDTQSPGIETLALVLLAVPFWRRGDGTDQFGLTAEECCRKDAARLHRDGGTKTGRWQTKGWRGGRGKQQGGKNKSEGSHSVLTTTSSNH